MGLPLQGGAADTRPSAEKMQIVFPEPAWKFVLLPEGVGALALSFKRMMRAAGLTLR